MAPDVDATAGTPKGWYGLEAVLAEKPVAALLATYLGDLPPARPRGSGLPPHAQPGMNPSTWSAVSSISHPRAAAGRLPGKSVDLPARITHWRRFRAGGGTMISMTGRLAASRGLSEIAGAMALAGPRIFAEVALQHALSQPGG